MRLIDADALYVDYLRPTTTTGTTCHAYVSKIQIDNAPTIEPQRKRGEWVEVNDYYNRISGKCSVCGWESHMYDDDVVGMNYCPNCGADLRETE